MVFLGLDKAYNRVDGGRFVENVKGIQCKWKNVNADKNFYSDTKACVNEW